MRNDENTPINFKLLLTILSILAILSSFVIYVVATRGIAIENSKDLIKYQSRIANLETTFVEIRVELAKINTRLDTNCDNIQEIKTDLKDIKEKI